MCRTRPQWLVFLSALSPACWATIGLGEIAVDLVGRYLGFSHADLGEVQLDLLEKDLEVIVRFPDLYDPDAIRRLS